jgi:hypothetical protein
MHIVSVEQESKTKKRIDRQAKIFDLLDCKEPMKCQRMPVGS